MARVRGADTTPELALRRALRDHGLPYSPGAKAPSGRPDIVFVDHRVAVFIDGCFWHGCPQHYSRPRSREVFWASKLMANLERDARQSTILDAADWRIVRLWEHEILEDVARAAAEVARVLRGEPGPLWSDQRRVRRVVEFQVGLERREVVRLGAPDEVIETAEGPRVTAKARVRR